MIVVGAGWQIKIITPLDLFNADGGVGNVYLQSVDMGYDKLEETMMTLSITEARENLHNLVDEVAESLSFRCGVVRGLMDLEKGREIKFSDVKKRLSLG